jgi:hypothetical protein
MTIYFKGLAITLVVLLPLILMIQYLLDMMAYTGLSAIAILLFIVLSLGLYLILKRLISHPNKQLFSSITILNILIKFIATAVLIFGFIKIASPPNNNFVICVLAVYLAFTGFETWFMTRLAQQSERSN